MRILFIGNSHTFVNGLPFQVRALLQQEQPDTQVAMYATPGVTIGWHAEQYETQMAILYQEWDYIVLQQRSHPFDGSAALQKDCQSLLPYLRRSHAKVLLFVTWAERRFPDNQVVIDDAFANVATEMNATLVPVSRAWQACLRRQPDIDLYDTDGEHAGPLGSYLAACTFYAVIQGHSPLGLTGRVEINGDVLVDAPPDVAARIQQVVTDTVLPKP